MPFEAANRLKTFNIRVMYFEKAENAKFLAECLEQKGVEVTKVKSVEDVEKERSRKNKVDGSKKDFVIVLSDDQIMEPIHRSGALSFCPQTSVSSYSAVDFAAPVLWQEIWLSASDSEDEKQDQMESIIETIHKENYDIDTDFDRSVLHIVDWAVIIDLPGEKRLLR